MILCLRAVRALAQATRPQAHHSQPRSTASALLLRRTFTGRIPLRPSLIIPAHASYALPQELSPASENWAEPSAGRHLDLVPKISSHPALAGIQVRNGPRNTYDPSHRVRKRRSGFLARVKTRTGRSTLARRRAKKRSTLSH